jgi:hypothetical protein
LGLVPDKAGVIPANPEKGFVIGQSLGILSTIIGFRARLDTRSARIAAMPPKHCGSSSVAFLTVSRTHGRFSKDSKDFVSTRISAMLFAENRTSDSGRSIAFSSREAHFPHETS